MIAQATVLVVDDDVTNIAIVAQLLEADFDIVFATSGPQALELIASTQPDVILLDVMMPEMDGYTVCKILKADPLTSAIPVIFVTGLLESESESYGLDLGAADYVTKPFNANVVRARVRNHVELKRARDRLASLAATDGLTGLANRRAFDAALDRECKRLARMHAPIGLALLDIDHFKAFNDAYGHVAGDDCLRRVAAAIAAAMHRPADLAARFGGEEFVCVLPDTSLDGATAVAVRIQTAMRELAIPQSRPKANGIVAASYGVISVVCAQETDTEALLLAADSCLYQAKADGRDRIVALGLPATGLA